MLMVFSKENMFFDALATAVVVVDGLYSIGFGM
jgi:hypothetical protein